jgi:hypothetical protein
MPEGRGMVEGTLLPDGTVLWLNGANKGAQGFGLAANPTMEALIYDPAATLGNRWTRGASSQIPQLYHSVALLLLDGTVMIAGSNPNVMPVLQPSTEAPHATEFRVEIYTPPYLSGGRASSRPANVVLSKLDLPARSDLAINFDCAQNARGLKVVLYHGGFVTHSLHMGHRMLSLDTVGFSAGETEQTVTASMPGNTNLTPPGPYVVYIVVDGVPSVGQFVNVFTTTEAPLSEQVTSHWLLSPENESSESAPLYFNTTTRLPDFASTSLEATSPTLDTPLLARQYSNTTTTTYPLTTTLSTTTQDLAHDRVLKPVPQTAHLEMAGGIDGGSLLDAPAPAMPMNLKLPPLNPIAHNSTVMSSTHSSEAATPPPAQPSAVSFTTSTLTPTTLAKRTRHHLARLEDE